MLFGKVFRKVWTTPSVEGVDSDAQNEKGDIGKSKKETISDICIFDQLPTEVRWECLKHLPNSDLLNCRLVNRQTKNIVDTLSKFEVTLALEDKLHQSVWSIKFRRLISFPWTGKGKKQKEDTNQDGKPQSSRSCTNKPRSRNRSPVNSGKTGVVEKSRRIPPFLKANKLIVRRLIHQTLNIQNHDLSSLLANVTVMDFLGLISGTNFSLIFQACPKVQRVRFCHESHGGPFLHRSKSPTQNCLQRLFSPHKNKACNKSSVGCHRKSMQEEEESSAREKMQLAAYEWPDLKMLEFDHSSDIAQVFGSKDFDVNAYCHRGVVSNRILNNIPVQYIHKRIQDCDSHLPIVVLTGSSSKLFCNVERKELRTLLLINIFHFNPEAEGLNYDSSSNSSIISQTGVDG